MTETTFTTDNCPVRTLEGPRMLGYALGTVGQMMPIGFFNSFTFQYYIYTIGLDPLLTSIGTFLGLFIYAFSSILFGVMVDNKKPGRFGKRKPFLLLAIPLMVILMVILWTPPEVCPIDNGFYWPVALYMWIVSIGINLNQGLIASTYLSMLSDQSTENENRVKIATLQGMFSILGTIISVFVPILILSNLEQPTQALWNTADGAYLMQSLPWIGLLFGGIGAICFLITFFSTDEKFYKEQKCDINKPSKSIIETFKQIFLPIQDKNYRNWMGNCFFFNISLRTMITIIMPLLTYVLLLEGTKFIIFILEVIPFAVYGYFLWTYAIIKRGLKFSYKLSLMINLAVSFAALIFLIPLGKSLLNILGVIILGIAISSLVGGYLFPNPIISRLIDDAPKEIKQDEKGAARDISGSYFGLYLFTLNIAAALANLILGTVLSGGNEYDPTIITLTLPISGIMIIASIWFLLRLKLPYLPPTKKY